ncbi:Glycosyltransferase involved in cell wall bisynthesis [Catalinimonas alkaloidigena]|uniref:Glycosyltransferase involved in cell wall bisynthesis n=2 Tax=Catalinimonas alkaloidigena TaxID=1075417 RepID=A0A1G9LI39_9BACT|nr:Glycosyltransferase involved in cell wall bisynthesis [Catalinimonas alkaloidigena]
MGRHSGYDLLFTEVERLQFATCYSLARNPNQRLPRGSTRLSNYLLRGASPAAAHTPQSTLLEWRAWEFAQKHAIDIIHVGYLEQHYGYLQRKQQAGKTKVVASVHQPASGWKNKRFGNPAMVRSLDGLIVLCKQDCSYFTQWLPKEKIHFVPHGIDTEFFSPADRPLPKQETVRGIFAGHWLRDFDVLVKVVDDVMQQHPGVHFDLVIPAKAALTPANAMRLLRYPRVVLHQNISDETLVNLYRGASFVLMPLLDSTANNVLLEGMACGLPVIATDVGGVVDYVDASFADLIPPNDIQGMVEKVLTIAAQPEESKRRGQAARDFAVKHFSWPVVAQQMSRVYQQLG